MLEAIVIKQASSNQDSNLSYFPRRKIRSNSMNVDSSLRGTIQLDSTERDKNGRWWANCSIGLDETMIMDRLGIEVR